MTNIYNTDYNNSKNTNRNISNNNSNNINNDNSNDNINENKSNKYAINYNSSNITDNRWFLVKKQSLTESHEPCALISRFRLSAQYQPYLSPL